MSRISKFIRLSALSLFIIICFSAISSAAVIGWVDYDFLFVAHPEYSIKNQEYQVKVAEYNEAYEAAIADVTDQEQLIELYNYYNSKLLEVEEQLRTYLVDSIKKFIALVAQEQNVDIVLSKSIVIYGGVDLTRLVVEAMYKSYGISVPSYLNLP